MQKNFEVVESMLGTDYLALGDTGDCPNFAAIRAAVAVFLARCPRVDLAEYEFTVCREDELIHVIFLDKERPRGTRGSGGRSGCPGYVVTLGADLVVVKAHFIR